MVGCPDFSFPDMLKLDTMNFNCKVESNCSLVAIFNRNFSKLFSSATALRTYNPQPTITKIANTAKKFLFIFELLLHSNCVIWGIFTNMAGADSKNEVYPCYHLLLTGINHQWHSPIRSAPFCIGRAYTKSSGVYLQRNLTSKLRKPTGSYVNYSLNLRVIWKFNFNNLLSKKS